MQVECEQVWEIMQPVEKGRFCHSCQKPVYDFTGWKREQVKSFIKEHPSTCGLYLLEQIDPSLHPIDFSWLQVRAKHLLIPLLTFVGLPYLKAQESQSDVSIEVVADSTKSSKTSQRTNTPENQNTGAVLKEAGKAYTVNPPTVSKAVKKRYKKFYWSKRFPFIHRKRSKVMGLLPRF